MPWTINCWFCILKFLELWDNSLFITSQDEDLWPPHFCHVTNISFTDQILKRWRAKMKSDVINHLVSLTPQFLSCLKLELLKDSQKSAKTLVCKIKVQWNHFMTSGKTCGIVFDTELFATKFFTVGINESGFIKHIRAEREVSYPTPSTALRRVNK